MAQLHRDALAGQQRRFDVVAAVDPVPERAAEFAAAFRGARPVREVSEVVDDIDAALVIAPHHVHHDVGLRLLQSGRHVLMEKPLALDEQECRDLIRASGAGGGILMVAYPMRYHPLVLSLRDQVRSGVVGEVFQMSIWTEQYTRYADAHWANRRSTVGGGQLFSHGCHYIDLLVWLLGEPVRGSHLGTRRGTEWMEGEGTSNVQIEFASGALGYHFGTWGARATRLGYRIHVHGTSGLLDADIIEGRLRLSAGGRTRTITQVNGHDKYLAHELEHFADVIDGRAVLRTDAETALRGLQIIWRLYEAADAGVVADLRGLGFGDTAGSVTAGIIG